jgi:hypothetical protein
MNIGNTSTFVKSNRFNLRPITAPSNYSNNCISPSNAQNIRNSNYNYHKYKNFGNNYTYANAVSTAWCVSANPNNNGLSPINYTKPSHAKGADIHLNGSEK